jgi:uncharacterized repeat protein (TIGR01451 family)
LFDPRGGSGRRIILAVVLLVCALPLAAITAPPVHGKASLDRMVDARVNLQDSYRRATAARANETRVGLAAAGRQVAQVAAAVAKLKGTMPGLEVKLSNLTGGPESVLNKSGALTAAAAGRNEDIVRDFLNRNGELYGLSGADVADLVAVGDSPGGTSGLRMLRMEQQIDGRPVFQSETRFLLDREGRLVKSVGLMVPHARSLVAQIKPATLLTPAEAVSRLLATAGKSVDPTAFTVSSEEDGRIQLTKIDDFVAGPITAREVLFPLAPGLLVRAWSLVVFTTGDQDWYAVVDAETGDLLWRKDIRDHASAQDARFRVYVQADGTTPADSPAPQSPNTVAPGSGTQFPEIAPTIVSMQTAMDPVASPNGWINDCPGGVCTANETQTLGNNVLACLDRTGGAGAANVCDTDAGSVLDGNGRPTGNPDTNGRNRDFLGTAPRDFQTNFLPPPQGGNPEAGQTATGAGTSGTAPIDQFRRGSVTHLFYLANWYHDKLYRLGFDEGAGNFQLTNLSGMGVGNDRVLADAQDSGGVDNANFSTPPDGTSGRMQMYRFTGPTIDRDGSLDAEIVLHELSHGTSNRLVGNGTGLNWDPARGMGEGWSDFYALSLLNNTNADTPTGRFPSGAYATYKLSGLAYFDNYVYGIRRFPYTSDNSVNPMTWADVDDVTNNLSGGMAPTPISFNLNGGMEVHNAGEVWALTLWDVRSRVIADAAGANGDVPTGNHTMLQLVTDGLKMTPINPNFTEARDAILQADCATNACANEASIWGGFADRGLGYGSQAPYKVMGRYVPSHQGVQESFSVPFLNVVAPLTDVTIDDSAANNNGAIDPGEPIKLTVRLTNPWRGAGKAVTGATATLTTTTPGVTIYDNTSTYGAIAPQGTATGDTFLITVASSVACGSAIDFTLTTVSNLGTTVATFRVRMGNRNGTDPVVTYTGDPNPDLVIADSRPRGVFNQINITDDFEIADVNFRVDSLNSPATGDLSVMLRSPGGVGLDLVSLIDGLNDCGGPTVTNMVIDDDVAAVATNDMVQATTANAPYSKSWLPVYNSPWAAIVNPALPADSVPNLSRYDGTSTKGTWSALASDNFSAASGGCPAGNGTFNAWSLIVTPVHFDCTAGFTGTVNVTATKTVTGTFQVGGTVTYTVTLTNNGTAAQADNAGNEFTDVLPAGLTLVSATATSGTAATAANTATWNGVLAPLGGSVTITITATVNAGAQGTTISNQGTVSYDANNDGTNEASNSTDDPGAGGASDPTVFAVGSAAISATKTVSGTFTAGSTVTYTIVLSNSGASASLDNAGNELTDVLPSGLTLVSATATSGTAATAANTVTWNGGIPAAGNVTITITATINAGTQGTVSNQATIAFDADLNGTNESSGTSDDPSVGGANDPTTFTVGAATLSATKTASGTFVAGSTVTYTIVISNTGSSASPDNAGNEFTDTLPASLTLVSATATSGTATTAASTVNWNGSIPAAGSVTITITATINAGTAAGTTISNQGSVSYDADLNGSNETTVQTDSPAAAGASDPTTFVVVGGGVVPPIPTLSEMGLMALGFFLLLAAWSTLRRRKTAI